ncbi:hypothetical protein ACFYPW_23985 [Micromonospora zamorensis]|uniref:hypothetical protein n=1 Tax=Micromonospora zamorensis TaxID=709883 RepID=UPI0036A0DCB8
MSLGLYMGSYLVWAAEDLTWVPAGLLHRRFLGWVRFGNTNASTWRRSPGAGSRASEPRCGRRR